MCRNTQEIILLSPVEDELKHSFKKVKTLNYKDKKYI